jgi:type VI secretion system secreted protein VgrG
MDPGLLTTAMGALTTAYNQAANLPHSVTDYTTYNSGNLAGLTLTPGVYTFSSSALLNGTLTLNDEGLTDPVFVFQIGSTLTTLPNSSVVTINAAAGTIPGTSVFWQVGSSATLDTTTAFEGNILANTSITLDTGATDLDGRLLAGAVAPSGAVTLDDNTLTAPPAELQASASVADMQSTIFLLGAGLAALFAFGRRVSVCVHNAE